MVELVQDVCSTVGDVPLVVMYCMKVSDAVFERVVKVSDTGPLPPVAVVTSPSTLVVRYCPTVSTTSGVICSVVLPPSELGEDLALLVDPWSVILSILPSLTVSVMEGDVLSDVDGARVAAREVTSGVGGPIGDEAIMGRSDVETLAVEAIVVPSGVDCSIVLGTIVVPSGVDGSTVVGTVVVPSGVEGGIVEGTTVVPSGVDGNIVVGTTVVPSGVDGSIVEGITVVTSGVEGGIVVGTTVVPSGVEGGIVVGATVVSSSVVGIGCVVA